MNKIILNIANTYYVKNNYLMISLLITLFTILIVRYFNILNPAIIFLIPVVFSTLLGGFRFGTITGLLSIVYCGYFFSSGGNLLSYTNENLCKIIVILIVIPLMVIMTGTLKKRVDVRTQQLELANKQLRLLSTLDGLTGISNRRYFEQLLAQEWQRSFLDKTPISIALIDIDFFKSYNDTYGHQAGDECLRQVTDAIATRIQRPGDFTARYGGEEFIVLLTNTPLEGVMKVGDDIRQLVESLKIQHRTSGINPYVTISIGIVSVIPSEYDNSSDFVKKADIALYHAKRCGRNKVQIYSEDSVNYCNFN